MSASDATDLQGMLRFLRGAGLHPTLLDPAELGGTSYSHTTDSGGGHIVQIPVDHGPRGWSTWIFDAHGTLLARSIDQLQKGSPCPPSRT